MERTGTAAFTVKWLWLGVDHYNARFFGSAAGVASGLFPVEVAAGRCHSAKQLRGQYSSGSRIVVLARSASVMIQMRTVGAMRYEARIRPPSWIAAQFALMS